MKWENVVRNVSVNREGMVCGEGERGRKRGGRKEDCLVNDHFSQLLMLFVTSYLVINVFSGSRALCQCRDGEAWWGLRWVKWAVI